MATRSKASILDLCLAGTAISNLTGGVDVYML